MALTATSFTGSSGSKSVGAQRPPFQLGEAIKIAAARSGLSHKQLCAYMDGLDPGTWSKALDGDGHVSLGRLLKVPDAFWDEFFPLLADHFGRTVGGGNGVSQSIARCLVSMADVIGRLELAGSADRKVSGL
jgi:hypothetical protein